MSRLIGNGIYRVAKAVERVSVRLGTGKFEVGNGYLCIECYRSPASPLCSECRMSWLYEVGHIDYSDAFEKRMNIAVGTTLLAMSLSAGFLNNSLSLWETGNAITSITAFLSSLTPAFLCIPDFLRLYYNIALGAIFLVALEGIFATMLISCFMMCVNPTSSRHWRHVTPSAIAAMFGLMFGYLVFFSKGVTPLDLGLVVAPGMTGIFGLTLVLCMKKAREEEVVERVDGDDKLV